VVFLHGLTKWTHRFPSIEFGLYLPLTWRRIEWLK